jgi:hypothetical protein
VLEEKKTINTIAIPNIKSTSTPPSKSCLSMYFY